MKHLKEFILEMSSTKFDLKKAFEHYNVFGIITDDPIKELTEGRLSKEKSLDDSTMIQLWDQTDKDKSGIINVEQILDNIVKDKTKGPIIWVVTERSKNSKCLNNKLIWKMILKGLYNGEEVDNKQIVIASSEDLLPKQLQNQLTPFIKI